MTTVNHFASTDPGAAPVMSGVVGALTDLLDQLLILGRGFSFDANAVSFTDNSAALRLRGAGAALFPQPASGDILYLGGLKKFSQAIFNLTVAATGGTFVYEYWDGSAWVSLVSPTDGTSALTVSGSITWDRDAQTGWAQTTINSVLLFWVRIRCTGTPSVGPEANLASVFGWGSPFQGTNGRTYRSELTSGVQHYYNVNDNGPGAGGAREARLYGAEVMSAFDTVTSGRFPTVVQFANGQFIRKSNTADATARAWRVLMDEKTVYLFILSADVANDYMNHGWGEFFSLVSGDLYRSFVSARRAENSALINSSTESLAVRLIAANSGATSSQGTYVARQYVGSGGALLVALTPGIPFCFVSSAMLGNVPTFNGPDGGIILAPVYLNEATHIRGRLRGLLDQAHAAAAWIDKDFFQGTGLLSARAYSIVKTILANDQNGNASGALAVIETSDTWETN